ncbi:MAG TPA: multicopper oxidase domain-containing protein [Actinoplanes sp.]|nr:multicopper oxidase domain-containing protein [Actinoplanes sp.]
MAVIEYWIQIENRRWDASPGNLDRMTGHTMQQAVAYTPTLETLNTRVPGSAPRQVRMFNPIRDGSGAVDALILRRYRPPSLADGSDAWTVPDDRKVNPWDINERDPGENGTRGTIPGPTLEMSVGDSMVVHFKNGDLRPNWDFDARTHSLHPHGVVFAASSDGAYPLSPPDPAQPVAPDPAHDETAVWVQAGVTGGFKQGDRVPPRGTFTYRWNTIGWPTTAGVWLYHDHSLNDMDNVELGAIGMMVIHNPADVQDVDTRLPTAADPTAYDPALMPGGSPAGSPIVRRPFLIDRLPITPADLARLRAEQPGEMAMGELPTEPGEPSVDDADTITPAPLARGRAINIGGPVAELDPTLTGINRLFLARYRTPPQRQQIMQLYHSMTGVGFTINGRVFLGNTPTVLSGVDTKMRFGLVGMGSMFHTFHLHGHRWILPGPHGSDPTTQQFSPMDTPVSQFEDTRTFGPANSFVFTIDEQTGSFMRAGGPGPTQALGEWHMHCHVLQHMMTGMMGSLLIVQGGELAFLLPVGRPPGQQGGTPPPPNEVRLTAGAQFSPLNLMINAGETVKWIWDNGDAHSVLSDTGVWDSGVKSGGPPFPEFSRTFPTAGTFPYHCVVHGTGMSGTITVM